MPSLCKHLDKKFDDYTIDGFHPDFRLFFSADPFKYAPIRHNSISVADIPPQGRLTNLHRAIAEFDRSSFEEFESKERSILFGLCRFHSIMLERKKFSPLGFNMMCPLFTGDLKDSASVLHNYFENAGATKIPWHDLRYIFGEIMYGGHLVDDKDRMLVKTYLEFEAQTQMVPYGGEGAPSSMSPAVSTYDGILAHINAMPSPDKPQYFGLHPNVEINFRTKECGMFMAALQEISPASAAGGGEGGESPVALAEASYAQIIEMLANMRFDMHGALRDLPDKEKSPTEIVFIQECDRINSLVDEMKANLAELALGFNGVLTMTDAMETLSNNLFCRRVPQRWINTSFPSDRSLFSWVNNLKRRQEQLFEWIDDPTTVPYVEDMSRLVHPKSFLTTVKHVANRNKVEKTN